ncbi:hypothetical protein [Thermogemmatispora tikiterensis]|uniref:Transmembrane protein n=1 Tax=Thermogemmatispora tikiterensis TaxID=1825093 RepID=A0A328VIH4_9CHLR|nr:hypothetical protein [Thermogemmatispora tikiterensis]RAQ97257.1 hypothetical protein A4R35_17090 [Thermogemmatispora tikiterensis]
MTRDADQRPANPRRQRPLLVISSSSSTAADRQSGQPAEGETQQTSARAEEQTSSSSAASRAEGAASASSARRQPGFFASVTQTASEQGQSERQPSPTDAGKMRLWRALRLRQGERPEGESGGAERVSKKAGETATKGQQQKVVRNMTKTPTPSETATAARGAAGRSGGQSASSTTAQTNRPLLKSRHFLGLFIYIFAATLLQIPLAYLSPILHLNQVLLQFSIANFPVVITYALVIYLVLLVALLVVLNQFDLLPSFGRTAEERRRSASQGSSSRSKAAGARGKETSKGEHDHLYEDYRDLRRYLRRRARKR